MKKIVYIFLMVFISSCSYFFNSKSDINKQTVNKKEIKNCYNCEGKTKVKCPRCKGVKKLHNFVRRKGHVLIDCERCKGKGLSTCEECNGTGIYDKLNALRRNIDLEK